MNLEEQHRADSDQIDGMIHKSAGAVVPYFKKSDALFEQMRAQGETYLGVVRETVMN